VPNPDNLARILDRLSLFGQEHLLRFWDDLDDSQRERLYLEIEGIDFDLIARLHREMVLDPPMAKAGTFAPLHGQNWKSLLVSRRKAIVGIGMKALSEGRAAAFLVAGGQGSRLGHDGPKGTLDISLPSGKSLFQLQAERLLKLSRDCGNPIPWYIMTSRDNHDATKAFFAARDFFGFDPAWVSFFPQGELPLIDAGGKILLAEKGCISFGSNGNGGCFQALKSSGALEDMRRRKVEWIFTYGVDNALVRVCDPGFLGWAITSGMPAASKSVARVDPAEHVGVFCLRNGHPSVLEYSEMTGEMRELRDNHGGLLYGSANIAVHLFRRDFLETHADESLPYHMARKKIPHVNGDSITVTPDAPNACKFELFMFDLFPKAAGMAIQEISRAEEFAPVKNPSALKVDSPATARKLVLDLHRRWAQSAGFSAGELEGLEVEVSPLTSYAGEGLTRSSFHRAPGRPVLWA
jgi:UDP-N-acetylglucosamine/UDP-N-acetylgalactosamine diphosphorylase